MGISGRELRHRFTCCVGENNGSSSGFLGGVATSSRKLCAMGGVVSLSPETAPFSKPRETGSNDAGDADAFAVESLSRSARDFLRAKLRSPCNASGATACEVETWVMPVEADRFGISVVYSGAAGAVLFAPTLILEPVIVLLKRRTRFGCHLIFQVPAVVFQVADKDFPFPHVPCRPHLATKGVRACSGQHAVEYRNADGSLSLLGR